MSEFAVEVGDAKVIFRHRKYGHEWSFPIVAAPHYVGTATCNENQNADRGMSLLHDDARVAALQALRNRS